MGPSGEQKNRQLITAVAVLVVIALIVTATIVTKKKDSGDIAADTSATTTTADNTTATNTADSSNTTTSDTATTSGYKDGTYTATGNYQSPGGSQQIGVSVTLKDGVVTASTVTEKATDNESEEYQSRFASGYKQSVIGKAIESITLSRVSGSSLTSQGFNDAINQIQSQAKV